MHACILWLYGWKNCSIVQKCIDSTKGYEVFIDIEELEGLL
jgi:hypothetical protein